MNMNVIVFDVNNFYLQLAKRYLHFLDEYAMGLGRSPG
jgi:hypothetical protein